MTMPKSRPREPKQSTQLITVGLNCGPSGAFFIHWNMASPKVGWRHSRAKMKMAVFASNMFTRFSAVKMPAMRIRAHTSVTTPRAVLLSTKICSMESVTAMADMYRASNVTVACLRSHCRLNLRSPRGRRFSPSQRKRPGTRTPSEQMLMQKKTVLGPKVSTRKPDIVQVMRPPIERAPHERLCRLEACSGASLESSAVRASIITSGMATETFTSTRKGTVAMPARGNAPKQVQASTPQMPASTMYEVRWYPKMGTASENMPKTGFTHHGTMAAATYRPAVAPSSCRTSEKKTLRAMLPTDMPTPWLSPYCNTAAGT
mmetsp:Transcript_69154/g.223520  ORF Transcript_69154/g.223520 Transcript_69154/m.223520 type:complete len:317 (-) Transcript_69154:301-1251(-)